MRTEDAFVVATIVALMCVGSLVSAAEIYRLNSEVEDLQSQQATVVEAAATE